MMMMMMMMMGAAVEAVVVVIIIIIHEHVVKCLNVGLLVIVFNIYRPAIKCH
jgi:hypothetical protein